MTEAADRPRRILLEVAVASVEDAVAAQSGGADRVELNTALAVGGMTPSLGWLIEVRQAVTVPIWAMVRPRAGGFFYSDAEFRAMRRDAELLLEHGADGIVFGVLNDDGAVDVARCRELVRQAGGGRCVFHRAFDVTPEPFQAIERLIDLGFRRVMTSGQEENAYNGTLLIKKLVSRSAGRIEVLPAGGVNRFTVADVVARTGCDQVHASLRGLRADPSTAARPRVSFAAAARPPEGHYEATDADAVVLLRGLLSL
jgi:copper homeostasis protein